MGVLEAIGTGLSGMGDLWVLAAVLGGAIIGLISGALPATGLPGIIVLISLALYMDPLVAIALAMGMAAPVQSSDTLPSVLLGVPGSVSSQATIIDGYPMARQGRAGEALGASYLASLIGGVVAAVLIAIIMPMAKLIVNAFASPEYLVMGIMGIVVVAVVSGGAMLKGLLSATVGMALAAVGTDPGLGLPRFVPDAVPYLLDGFNLIIVVIGIFAVPELMALIIENRSIASGVSKEEALRDINRGRWEGMRQVFQHKFLVFRSVVLGVIVGIMPGIGGSVVDWLTYAQARATEKGAAETFGTGDIRGVIAPESANNATSAAQLIPTLALGIPGGAYQAVYLGFFILLGFQPGPRFLDQNLDIVFFIVFCLLLANFFGTLMLLYFSKHFARIAFVQPHILAPVILAVLLVASFTSKNSYWDLGFLVVVSVVGWHMKRYGWPRPPLIIGFVLGPLLERYMSRTLPVYDFVDLITRWQSLAIVGIALLIAFYSAKLARDSRRAAQLVAIQVDTGVAEPEAPTPPGQR